MNIPILFEDNHLLVVEKPVNIPVQEDRSKDKDLLSLLKEDIKIRYHKPGNVYLGLVHRLDRPVGGTIVFAKTSKAASRLSNSIRLGQFDRTYFAVTRGILKEKKGLLTHYLYKDQRKNKVYAVNNDRKDAKKAILEYEVLEEKQNFSLVKVKLHTGRSHQIRVQLATIGHPLYGDQKYGEKVNKPGQQIALWSHSVLFPHPVKKEEVEFTSLPPKTFPWNLFQILQ